MIDYNELNEILTDHPAGSQARIDALEEYALDQLRDAGDHFATGRNELARQCCERAELARRVASDKPADIKQRRAEVTAWLKGQTHQGAAHG